MEEAVRQELEGLKGMVRAWKESYMNLAGEIGGGEFLCEEFLQEMHDHIFPYLNRICECNIVDNDQVKDEVRDQVREFTVFCHRQVMELRTFMKEEEGEHA